MANPYLIRVELHGVNHEHQVYTDLHEKMEEAGFVRYIVASDKTKYQLPSAMYCGSGETATDVRDRVDVVIAALAKAQPAGSPWKGSREILVVPYAHWAFTGLKPWKEK